jgi:hypothetical protein
MAQPARSAAGLGDVPGSKILVIVQGFSGLLGGCQLHGGPETQLGAKLKRHPKEEDQSGEDTHGEAGENASQLASTVLDHADNDKSGEKEDGK